MEGPVREDSEESPARAEPVQIRAAQVLPLVAVAAVVEVARRGVTRCEEPARGDPAVVAGKRDSRCLVRHDADGGQEGRRQNQSQEPLPHPWRRLGGGDGEHNPQLPPTAIDFAIASLTT